MNQNASVDMILGCARCNESFVFSAGEQELLRLRGAAVATPQHCPRCRARGYSEHSAPRAA
jgi:putative zinc ribbon protein